MEYTFTCTVDLRVAAAVVFGLLMFGIRYNHWVANLEEDGHDRGYMGFIVAIGCAVTVVGAALAAWSVGLGVVVLAAFAASGIPMIWGSVKRYIEARARDTERARRDAEQALRDGR